MHIANYTKVVGRRQGRKTERKGRKEMRGGNDGLIHLNMCYITLPHCCLIKFAINM